MKVLIVGSGGREHALAWKIAQSPLLEALFIAPGNAGTAQIGTNVAVAAADIEGIVEVARNNAIDFVVVGPDDPLAAGLVDRCNECGLVAFGPNAAAARIESSKSFAKAVMVEAGVATPMSHSFDSPDHAKRFVEQSKQPWVVKADGLALGKGVIVAEDIAATLAAIEQLAKLPAGTRILLEERIAGLEVSLLALCDGKNLLPLPPAHDHKRLGEGDTGPNTGGMGAYAPSERVSEATFTQIVERCMRPVVDLLAARGTPFRGALYAGIMLTEEGPRVLEFNARFGDPETQAILPLLRGDLLPALYACATGTLSPDMIDWDEDLHAACVVVAAPGYPDATGTGAPILGLESVTDEHVLVFHAGTAWKDSEIVTSGGRVLGVTGLGSTLQSALDRAYNTINTITIEGMQVRHDIGRNAEGPLL